MKIFFTLIIFLSKASLFASGSHTILKNSFTTNYFGFTRSYQIEYPFNNQDQEILSYRSEYRQVNPFIQYPYSTVTDTVSSGRNLIFSKIYHTGIFGLRLTPNLNPKAEKHLIFSGDSNMFGVGVLDQETLPARIGARLESHSVYNMGLAGTGPNCTLYFLEHFGLQKIINNQKKGAFIYDFQHYLIERVVGSKGYIQTAEFFPRYVMENGKLVYVGTFRKYWATWFYKLLNHLPYHQTLFPNLPRIGHSHIELTAKVFAKMKEEYLRQTDVHNRFIVIFNPSTIQIDTRDDINYLQECLKKEGIETLSFESAEQLPLPKIENEGHFSALAHENYSKMVINKLDSLLKLSHKREGQY